MLVDGYMYLSLCICGLYLGYDLLVLFVWPWSYWDGVNEGRIAAVICHFQNGIVDTCQSKWRIFVMDLMILIIIGGCIWSVKVYNDVLVYAWQGLTKHKESRIVYATSKRFTRKIETHYYQCLWNDFSFITIFLLFHSIRLVSLPSTKRYWYVSMWYVRGRLWYSVLHRVI